MRCDCRQLETEQIENRQLTTRLMDKHGEETGSSLPRAPAKKEGGILFPRRSVPSGLAPSPCGVPLMLADGRSVPLSSVSDLCNLAMTVPFWLLVTRYTCDVEMFSFTQKILCESFTDDLRVDTFWDRKL